jgi:hypothetical protein
LRRKIADLPIFDSIRRKRLSILLHPLKVIWYRKFHFGQVVIYFQDVVDGESVGTGAEEISIHTHILAFD